MNRQSSVVLSYSCIRHRERGSVLVLCIGFLVVMAVLATAVISVMTLHSSVGKQISTQSILQLAALSAQAYVMNVITKTYSDATCNNSFALMDMLRRQYFGGTSTPNATSPTAGNLWEYAGVYRTEDYYGTTDSFKSVWAIYSEEDTRGRWLYLGSNNVTTDASNASAGYDKNWKYTTNATDVFYSLRFAVGVVDLTGCWMINPHPSLTNKTEWGNALKRMLDCKEAWNATSSFAKSANVTTVFTGTTNQYSWEHLQNSANNVTRDNRANDGPRYLFTLTPFGERNQNIPFKINVFTAPPAVLDAAILAMYRSIDIPTGWHDTEPHGFNLAENVKLLRMNNDTYSNPAGTNTKEFLWDIVVALHNTAACARLNAATYLNSAANSIKTDLGNYFTSQLSGKIENLYTEAPFDAGETYTDADVKKYAFRAARMEQVLNDVFYNVFEGTHQDWDKNTSTIPCGGTNYTFNYIWGGRDVTTGTDGYRFNAPYPQNPTRSPPPLPGTGRWTFEKGSFYRVIIRTQIYNVITDAPENECNLEFVLYCQDLDGNPTTTTDNAVAILYQRWVDIHDAR